MCITRLSLHQMFMRQASSLEWTQKQILYMVKLSCFPKMFLRSMECVKSLPEILLMCERLYRAVSPVGMGCMGNTSACGVCSLLFCVEVTMPHKPEMELHDSGYKSYYVGSSGSALLRCRLTAVSTRQPVWCCSASQGKHW